MGSRFANRRFAPAWQWTLLATCGVALFCSLGRWQLHRADEKRALDASFVAGASAAQPLGSGLSPLPRYQRVSVWGHFDAAHQFLLDNMTHDGVPGFHVLTPLVRADGSVILVDRGFLPMRGARDDLPPLPVDEQRREVTGRIDELPRPAIRLAAPPASGWPRLVSFPTHAELQSALDIPVHPQLLLLDPGEADGYLRDWKPTGLTPERHLSYAIQWFGMATAVFITWLILSFKKESDAK